MMSCEPLNSDHQPPQSVTFTPKHCGYDKSTVGVITAECCVSGAFFRDFPQMALVWEQPIFPQKCVVAGSSDVESQNNDGRCSPLLPIGLVWVALGSTAWIDDALRPSLT